MFRPRVQGLAEVPAHLWGELVPCLWGCEPGSFCWPSSVGGQLFFRARFFDRLFFLNFRPDVGFLAYQAENSLGSGLEYFDGEVFLSNTKIFTGRLDCLGHIFSVKVFSFR